MRGFIIAAASIFISKLVLAQVCFEIESLPGKTPVKDTIFLASSINHWNTCDKSFSFTMNSKGNLSLVLKNNVDSFEYKLCRGNWSKVEVDSLGREIKNRFYTTKPGSTVKLKVSGWKDLSPKRKPTITKGVTFMPNNLDASQLSRIPIIRIYFPPDYSSGKRFPVIYMHDGQNLFDETTSFAGEWRVDEILDSLYKFHHFSCIVVGIYNGGNKRMDEYSPWKNDSLGIGGDGDKYAKYIIKTLKPFIDSHYRTLTDRENTAVIGSSMGGLISLYIALTYPDVFGKAAAFSPSLWFSPRIFELIQKSKSNKLQKIYLLSGGKEGYNTVSNTLKADSLLRKAGLDDDFLKCKISKDGQHNEWFWSNEFGDAIRFLFNF